MMIVAVGVTIAITSQEPEHESGFTLDEVVFLPSHDLDLSDSGGAIDAQLRDELGNSTFTLAIEIEQTPYRWVQNYTYAFEEGKDLLELDRSNRPDMRMTDWEYGKQYDFSVQFICGSDNQTVLDLQYFDEDLFISGSFVVRDRRVDEVVLDLDDDRQVEYRGRQWIVYCGEVDFPTGIDLDAWVIEVEEDGTACSN